MCAWESVKWVSSKIHTVTWPPFPDAEAAPGEGVSTVRSGCAGSASLMSAGRKGDSLHFRAPAQGVLWEGAGTAAWASAVGATSLGCPGSGPWAVSFTLLFGSLPAKQTARGPEDRPAEGDRGPVLWRKHTGLCLQQEGLSSCDVLVQRLSPLPLPPSLAGGLASRVSEGG